MHLLFILETGNMSIEHSTHILFSLFEKYISIDYITAKVKNTIHSFTASWGDGKGIFQISGDLIFDRYYGMRIQRHKLIS